MLNNGASDSEISAEIQDVKEKLDELIKNDQNNVADQFKPTEDPSEGGFTETDSAIKDANDAVQDANDAIQNDSSSDLEGAKDKLENAFGRLEDQLKNDTTGDWLKGDALKEQLGDMAQDFRDTANAMPDGEAKDAWNDLADAFEQAKDQATQGKNDEAIDTATGALDKAEQIFQGAIGKLEDLKDTQDSANDRFEEGQSGIMGTKPLPKPEEDKGQSGDKNEDKQEGNKGDKNENEESDKSEGGESEENQPDMNKPNSGSSGSGEIEKETDKIFVPGVGNITVEQLVDMGLLDSEYDKQFNRELSDEERQTIENYFASLRQDEK